MTSRERLPNRRPALTFDLETGGQRYAATIGSYSDGRPAEIFLTASRAGSQADTSARDAAIVVRALSAASHCSLLALTLISPECSTVASVELVSGMTFLSRPSPADTCVELISRLPSQCSIRALRILLFWILPRCSSDMTKPGFQPLVILGVIWRGTEARALGAGDDWPG